MKVDFLTFSVITNERKYNTLNHFPDGQETHEKRARAAVDGRVRLHLQATITNVPQAMTEQSPNGHKVKTEQSGNGHQARIDKGLQDGAEIRTPPL